MKQLRIFAIIMVAILMVSCNKDEQATGVGDVLIVSKLSGLNTVYGISIYAYSLSTFSSVKVVSASDPGKIYTLKSNQDSKRSFYYETPENEFTTTRPAADTYNFSATFENGINQTFQNVLTDLVLPIPSIEKCEYNADGHQLDLNWTLIDVASSYSISIFEGSKLVFRSLELSKTLKIFSIKANGGGWDVNYVPENGKTYIVRLFAYLYEPGGGAFNIQAASFAERSVVWGN